MGPARKFDVIDRLNDEWRGLVEGSAASVQRWAEQDAAFWGCGDLAAVISRISCQPDPTLRALLILGRQGDSLAYRTILQAMLGKIVRLAQRAPDASPADFVAAMWVRISTYPLANRPRRIAANLALDTLKSVSRERRQEASGAGPSPAAVANLGLPGVAFDASPFSAYDVIEAAARLQMIDPVTRELLISVYAEGLSSKEAASRHGTSPGMVRFRCSRAMRNLAAHREALLEAS